MKYVKLENTIVKQFHILEFQNESLSKLLKRPVAGGAINLGKLEDQANRLVIVKGWLESRWRSRAAVWGTGEGDSRPVTRI